MFLSRDNCYTMNDLCKVFNIKGYGRNNMFKYLRNKKVLRKNNTPYQRFVNKFKVIENKNQKLKYDKTFKSTIWGKNEDGTYQISYMNQLYNVYNALGTDLELGQSVWVKIPSGIFRNMHICGVNYKQRK